MVFILRPCGMRSIGEIALVRQHGGSSPAKKNELQFFVAPRKAKCERVADTYDSFLNFNLLRSLLQLRFRILPNKKTRPFAYSYAKGRALVTWFHPNFHLQK